MVLLESSITIDGLRIYGAPAFWVLNPNGEAPYWARIPANTHVLLTHGPPYGINDSPAGSGEHQGDPELLAAIEKLPNLILCVSGHVHGGYGLVETKAVTLLNASLMGLDGELEQPPHVIRLNRSR